jgi:hypothetical protein
MTLTLELKKVLELRYSKVLEVRECDRIKAHQYSNK